MTPTLERSPVWLRAVALIYSAAILIWLPVEDTTTRGPSLFAAGATVLLAVARYRRLSLTPCTNTWWRFTLSGALLGTILPVLTLFLMLFKGGLHGHGFPDFTVGQFASVAAKTPVSALAGLAIGLGWSYRWWLRCQ